MWHELNRILRAGGLISAAALVIGSVATLAQILPPPPPPDPNFREVFLVRQDSSDCTNANVPSGDGPGVSGTVSIERESNGMTNVKISMTASPKTTYHFFLKCIRRLGDIQTGDEGIGEAVFTFATNSVGNVYGFDSYPEGAPAGNKFQSAQVKYQ
jgi:hypothetical protein